MTFKKLNLIQLTSAVVVAILFILLYSCLILSQQDFDADVWFHLKYGEYFFNNHTWSIDHSLFSWTPAAKDWPYVTWLGSSLLYIVYIIFPLPVLFYLPALLTFFVFIIYCLYLRSISARINIEALSLFLITALCLHNPVKPAIFSWFFFALCVAIYFSGRQRLKKRYYWYPLIFLLWVNIHGAFIFGLFFIALAFFVECFMTLLRRTPEPNNKAYLLGFGASIFLSFLVLLVNPYGINYLIGLARGALFAQEFADPSKYIIEYTHLWSTLMPTGVKAGLTGASWYAVFLLLAYLLLALLAWRKGRRPDIVSLVLMVLFFLLSMAYARCLVFFRTGFSFFH